MLAAANRGTTGIGRHRAKDVDSTASEQASAQVVPEPHGCVCRAVSLSHQPEIPSDQAHSRLDRPECAVYPDAAARFSLSHGGGGRALASLARARVLWARRQNLRAQISLLRGPTHLPSSRVPCFLPELVNPGRCERHGSSPRLAPRGSLHGRFGVGPGHNMRADRVRAQGGAPRGRGSMLRSAQVQGVGGRAGLVSPWRDTRLSGLQSRLPGWTPRQPHT